MSVLFRQIRPGLELREMEPDDAQQVFDLVERNRAMLEEWEPGMAFTSAAGVRAFFSQEMKDDFRLPLNLGIFEDGELRGMVQLASGSNRSEASIGYWLSGEHQGRGLVTEAVRALVQAAFDGMGYEHIVIDCSERNIRSRRVPERLGFTLAQYIPPEQLRRGPDGPGQLFFGMYDWQWRGEPPPTGFPAAPPANRPRSEPDTSPE